jgi:Rad3-related DNA helicase
MSVKSDEENNFILPDEFPFPYEKPYDIQLNFMKALYKTLELKKVGIFESPTGTVINAVVF